MKLKMKYPGRGRIMPIKIMGIENEEGNVLFHVKHPHREGWAFYDELVFDSEEQETELIMEYGLEEKDASMSCL